MNNNSRFTYRQLHILHVLSQDNTMNSEELAELCGVSSKTIRSNINTLTELLKDSGGELIIKKGQGYSIRINDRLKFSRFLVDIFEQTKASRPDCPAERQIYILFWMIDGKTISRNDTMAYFVVNPPTWNKQIRAFENMLQYYHLELEQHHTKSDIFYSVKGSEFNLRQCFIYRTNWYGHGAIKDQGGNPDEYLCLKNYLIRLLQKNGILVFRHLFDDLCNSIYFSVLRVRKGYPCNGLSKQYDRNLTLNGSHMRPTAEQLAHWMEAQFHITLNEDEILYIQLMLAAKTEYGGYIINMDIPVPDEILEFEEKSEKLFIDDISYFIRNSKLCQLEVLNCIIPTYIRLTHGIYIFSPDMRKIKKQYPESYRLSESVAPMFDEIGTIPITEEELCRIAAMIEALSKIKAIYSLD